ncbi:MAG TPA: MBL fold metallo-hydrolase [Armatimonadota bacterium]|nr:MBL fold metallo-hydrolase [Armatimonadota bacterium]
MEIMICGTAAAEGWPALFCHCKPCAEARKRGGKNLRSRSAYQIGETIRIDFGPDCNLHQQKFGLAYERLEHLLMSHSHWDHWSPLDLDNRKRGFSLIPETAVLNIYGNERVRSKLETAIGPNFAKCLIEFHPIELWTPIPLSDGVAATPVEATHDPGETCVNWVVERNGRRFLQGHDTGVWKEPTWQYLSAHPLNAVVMDCTNGPGPIMGSGHLNGAQVIAARDRLADTGALAPGCRFIATHFSHNGGALHEELEEFFSPHGIEVAYDGMKIEL